MTVIYTGSSGEIYRQQLKDLLEAPEVTVRGRPTRELLNVVTELKSPLEMVQSVPGRRWNPWLALSEGLALLAGTDRVDLLKPYNKRIVKFSDNGVTLYGSYGARIYGQIVPLLNRLLIEQTDRRAILQIWDAHDLVAETKDPPCNDMVMFKVRDELLHMTVINRSNDLHWGLYAVNLPEFGMLQQYLANKLEVGLGQQTHFSNSLHIYLDGPQAEITERMMEAMDEPLPEYPSSYLFPDPKYLDLTTHSTFANMCLDVLEGKNVGIPFLDFAKDFLRIYRECATKGTRLSVLENSSLNHATQFSSWVRAGKEFLAL